MRPLIGRPGHGCRIEISDRASASQFSSSVGRAQPSLCSEAQHLIFTQLSSAATLGSFFVSAACDDEGVGALAGKSDILVNNVNQFKARLDKFWMHQDVKFDFTADLTGIGDRSVRVICDV